MKIVRYRGRGSQWLPPPLHTCLRQHRCQRLHWLSLCSCLKLCRTAPQLLQPARWWSTEHALACMVAAASIISWLDTQYICSLFCEMPLFTVHLQWQQSKFGRLSSTATNWAATDKALSRFLDQSAAGHQSALSCHHTKSSANCISSINKKVTSKCRSRATQLWLCAATLS